MAAHWAANFSCSRRISFNTMIKAAQACFTSEVTRVVARRKSEPRASFGGQAQVPEGDQASGKTSPRA